MSSEEGRAEKSKGNFSELGILWSAVLEDQSEVLLGSSPHDPWEDVPEVSSQQTLKNLNSEASNLCIL